VALIGSHSSSKPDLQSPGRADSRQSVVGGRLPVGGMKRKLRECQAEGRAQGKCRRKSSMEE
jgi:hypothetical protein